MDRPRPELGDDTALLEPDLDEVTIRVLHVDDEPGFADLCATYLQREDEDLAVTTAMDVEGALDVWTSSDVDCVVSDYQMPGRDGLDLLAEIRDDDPEVPFVLFTGKGNEDIASRAISAGVDDYLQKDSGTDQYALLATRIRTLVDKTRTERRLRNLKERYEAVAKSTADALWDWHIAADSVDPSDTVVRGFGFTGTFGYDPENVAQELGWWADRIHPEDREAVLDEVDRVVAAGETFYEDRYRFRRASGAYTEVLSRAYVIYRDGDPVHMVGSIIDT